MEFFEALIGCAIKYNDNLSNLSSTKSFKNKSPISPVQITENVHEVTTASRPSSKSQYINSKSESKSTDYYPHIEVKTENNGKKSNLIKSLSIIT